MIIPAITLWQPWASLIADGVKSFETRSFPAPSRLLGQRVAIHAAARPVVTDISWPLARELYELFGGGWNYSLPRGAVVCTAIIMESLPAAEVQADLFGDYSPGRWAWRLGSVQPICPPIPAKGRQAIGWPWEFIVNGAAAVAVAPRGHPRGGLRPPSGARSPAPSTS